MPVQVEETEDYKTKYRNLKRKLKILIYENECFQEELGKANRALLRVRQDKSFLLDQLLPLYQPAVSSSDSDLTDNSDNETSSFTQAIKRKRASEALVAATATTTAAHTSLPQTASVGVGKVVSKAGASGGNKQQNTSNTAGSNSSNSSIGNKPGAAAAPTAATTAGKKRATAAAATKQTARSSSSSSKQRRPPQKLQKLQLPQAQALRAAGLNSTLLEGCGDVGSAAAVALERELSREEVERHLMARQTIADFNTPMSLTLPHQLFSDNLLDGDILGEEIETSSNIDEDITVDNCD